MLVIAIPKSASTSLLRSYAKRHGLRSFMGSEGYVRNELIYDVPYSANYHLLSKYHFTDFKEVDNFMVDKYLHNCCIYKSHIAPTIHNKKTLEKIKKVVLLRNPMEIISAYYRAEKKKIHRQKEEFKNIHTEKDWIQEAKNNGLLEELNNFYHIWKNTNDEYTLIIGYTELVENPNNVFLKMDRFYGLPEIEGDTELLKEKYSRYKLHEKILIKLRRMYEHFVLQK